MALVFFLGLVMAYSGMIMPTFTEITFALKFHALKTNNIFYAVASKINTGKDQILLVYR